MKTIIIIAVLAVVVFYSLRSIVKHFKGEDDCCAGCSGKNGGQCHCGHKKNQLINNSAK